MTLSLRPYQLDAAECIRVEVRRQRALALMARILCVAPTGSGKTILFSEITREVSSRDKRTLICAHRRELIDQTYRKVLEAGVPACDVGVIMAKDKRTNAGAKVQIASIDTLRNRTPLYPFDVVIIDEAHRALAPSYQRLQTDYPQAIHLGFTATPILLSGRGLGEAYNGLVQVATVKQLQALGFLVKVRAVSHDEKPDLSNVKLTSTGDYDVASLAAATGTKRLIGNIVQHWLELAAGARTIAFSASVENSINTAAAFVAAGVPAEHLDAETPAAERAAILARLKTGETLVVVNVGVLCEGFDEPLVKCVVLARPTMSKALYLQQAGRGMRPIPGVPEVTHCRIIDHAGCCQMHGLPSDPQDWSLEGRKKRAGATSEASPWRCNCGAWNDVEDEVCEACGAERPVDARSRVLTEEEGKLKELTETAARDEEIETKRRKRFRSLIQSIAHEYDDLRMAAKVPDWGPTTTNAKLYAVFGTRTTMPADRLAVVLAYLRGEFLLRHPAPAPVPLVVPVLGPVTLEAVRSAHSAHSAAQAASGAPAAAPAISLPELPELPDDAGVREWTF